MDELWGSLHIFSFYTYKKINSSDKKLFIKYQSKVGVPVLLQGQTKNDIILKKIPAGITRFDA